MFLFSIFNFACMESIGELEYFRQTQQDRHRCQQNLRRVTEHPQVTVGKT